MHAPTTAVDYNRKSFALLLNGNAKNPKSKKGKKKYKNKMFLLEAGSITARRRHAVDPLYITSPESC